ncbi:MAG: amidohydrolase family protein [Planctomycetota bacterium]|jgi:predicted TIM-barrel fold metal-dependent hydrolase|nr:amidohydrolase family protein [Planctomycetota bacterium]MDP7252805.1 amidohydrolase family protein [Planctomycetota bacterium]
MIIDSHVHTGVTKYVPVEALVGQMDAAGIDKAILVQYGGQFDNTYEKEVCERYPGKFAPWGMVDTSSPDAARLFKEAVERDGMVGFRVPAGARSVNGDPWDMWKTLEQHDVVASLSGSRDNYGTPETAELIERHPGIRFRIEHLGHPQLDEDAPFPKFQKVLDLARFSNVVINYSGLYGASKEGFPYKDIEHFLKMIYDAFGPHRIMWGSDFPPVCMRETVAMNLELFKEGFGFLTDEDLEWILAESALKFTRFV